MWRSVKSASVQWDATRTTSTPRSIARDRSRSMVAKPGIMCTPSRERLRFSRARRRATSSGQAARPSCSDEAPMPLPWPTSTIGTPAASAARQYAAICSAVSWCRTAWFPSRSDGSLISRRFAAPLLPDRDGPELSGMCLRDGHGRAIDDVQVPRVRGEIVAEAPDPDHDDDAAVLEDGIDQHLVAGDVLAHALDDLVEAALEAGHVRIADFREQRRLHVDAGLGGIEVQDRLRVARSREALEAELGRVHVLVEVAPRRGFGASRGDAGDDLDVLD